MPLVIDVHLNIQPLTTTLCMQPSNQFLIHQRVHPLSLRFRVKGVVGDHVRGLTEVQIDDISSCSLVH